MFGIQWKAIKCKMFVNFTSFSINPHDTHDPSTAVREQLIHGASAKVFKTHRGTNMKCSRVYRHREIERGINFGSC
jgi:hypothetical protein